MRVDELLRHTELSRDEILKRIQNSKSKEEKEMWAAKLVKERGRIQISEEALADYVKRLVTKHRIKKLGAGAYAQVFQHPKLGNVVVKVFTDKDVIYKKYLKWCRANQGNKYAPKILDMVEYKSDTGDRYNIVFMEKLSPIKDWAQFMRVIAKSFTDPKSEDSQSVLSDLYDSAEVEDAYKAFDTGVKLGLMDEDFANWWRHVRSYGKARFDVHPGNVMLRGRQLVFSDPVANDPTSRVDEL